MALGNRHISSDKLGVETLSNLVVTNIMPGTKLPKITCVAPSVYGITGLESATIVKAIAQETKPDLIIVIDSLCANNYDRLGTNFQINNFGITPGAGIQNARTEITEHSMNTKVITIGIPMVMYAKSLVVNAMEELKIHSDDVQIANIEKVEQSAKNLDLNNLVFTLKDVDIKVKVLGRIIGYALNKALLDLSISEQKRMLEQI